MGEGEPFVGLADFLLRHATHDDASYLSCRKIFIAYRTYITRKRPDIIVSMDFARFCSYLEHLAQQFQYKKRSIGNPHSTLYRIRFRSLKKLQKIKKRNHRPKVLKVLIRDLNENICCKLCCGYLVNATTIKECLHTFCRSCIVKHFRTNRRCPICDILIHETEPLSFVKQDNLLQDIVYKLLPGLERSEKNRENEFNDKQYVQQNNPTTPTTTNTISRPDLQFKPIQFILEWVGLKHCSLMAEQIPERFIRVSSQATIGHVSQFVLQKLQNIDSDLKPTVQCDIKCGGVTLPPILTLEQIEKHDLCFETKKDWLYLQYDIKPLEDN